MKVFVAVVGEADGVTVGDVVGAGVGAAVGDVVGVTVGSAVGDPVGEFVGDPVGAVGDVVGDGVCSEGMSMMAEGQFMPSLKPVAALLATHASVTPPSEPALHEACVFVEAEMSFQQPELSGMVIGSCNSKMPRPSFALKNTLGVPEPVKVYAAPNAVVPL